MQLLLTLLVISSFALYSTSFKLNRFTSMTRSMRIEKSDKFITRFLMTTEDANNGSEASKSSSSESSKFANAGQDFISFFLYSVIIASVSREFWYPTVEPFLHK